MNRADRHASLRPPWHLAQSGRFAWLSAFCIGLAGCPDAPGAEAEASSVSDSSSPADGPGCGKPPSCNRGPFVGSMRVGSEEQADLIAGYTSVTGWLEIVETDLVCLDFLSCLEDVGHDVSVFGNGSLKDLGGFDQLTAVGTVADGNVVISTNAVLTDLDGFESLASVPGSLNVTRHEKLQDVSGFSALRQIQGDLTIQSNPLLEQLSGMHDLEVVDGRFVVTKNPSLCIGEISEVGADLVSGPDGGSTASNKGGC